jgi:N-acetylglucosaminyldiphosphoundecaprenol N-acetyl-beta-D-mannosaminyltransferase
MERKRLLSIDVNLGSYDSFVDKLIKEALAGNSYYACVANVHMLIEAHQSSQYADIVNQAGMVTPDGIPLGWALRFLYGIKQQRVAGMDLLPDLLKMAEEKQIPVAFYGGTDEMLTKTRLHLEKKYPGLIVSKLYSPPFRPLSMTEEYSIINSLNSSGAKMIFVVLGCPKQERWMAGMKDKIPAVMIGVGGALPVLIGTKKRAPLWMQKSGFEWLFRLTQEFNRLFMRYAKTNSIFIDLVIKEKLQYKFSTNKAGSQKDFGN